LPTENKTPESTSRAPDKSLDSLEWLSGVDQKAIHISSEKGQLITFGERLTFTFAYGKEVGSIHFDKGRGEIFYKGHNINNIEIENWQIMMLEKVRQILTRDEKLRNFAAPYSRSLDKTLQEIRRVKKGI